MTRLLRRIYLFAKDYAGEFGIAWSLARMRDCERWGGHYWGQVHDDVLGRVRACSGCGTSELVHETNGTGSTMTITPNMTTYN